MGTSNVILKKVKSTDTIGTLQIQYFNGKGKKKQMSLSLKISEENFTKYYDKEFKQFRKNNIFDYLTYNNRIKDHLSNSPFEINNNNSPKYLLEYISETMLDIDNLNTREGYKVVQKHLKSFLEIIGENDIEIKSVNIELLISFKKFLQKKNITNSTIYHYFVILKGILNKINVQDFNVGYLKNIFKILNIKVPPSRVKDLLTTEDVMKLISVTSDYRYFNYVQMGLTQLFGMGMRFSDLSMLRVEDFQNTGITYTTKKNTKTIIIPYESGLLIYVLLNIFKLKLPPVNPYNYTIEKHNLIKGNSSVTNELSDFNTYTNLEKEKYEKQLIKILLHHIKTLPKKQFIFNEYFNSNELLKYSKRDEMTESQLKDYKSMSLRYNYYLKKIKTDLKLDLDNISSHTFRHSFTNFMIEEGLGVYEISQSLSHSGVVITQKYLTKNFDLKKIKDLNKTTFGRFKQ
ncbi:phage integrase SAM-like domain-containing protein [Flavobacterium sp.]|jgi:integrase|uniref:tyrosine-type recombinase/integrase n=1 Tax=Flavobacterium sp. TaxID=239 RepID=UPI003340C10A